MFHKAVNVRGESLKLLNRNASYKLINKILSAVYNKVTVRGILCDLEKSFNWVDHNILLFKLEFCGIVGKFNALINPTLQKDIREFQQVTEILTIVTNHQNYMQPRIVPFQQT